MPTQENKSNNSGSLLLAVVFVGLFALAKNYSKQTTASDSRPSSTESTSSIQSNSQDIPRDVSQEITKNNSENEGISNNNYSSSNSSSQQKCSYCNGSGRCSNCNRTFTVHFWGGNGWKDRNESRPGQIMCSTCQGSGLIYGSAPINSGDPDSKPCYISGCHNGWLVCSECNYDGNGKNIGVCNHCNGKGFN